MPSHAHQASLNLLSALHTGSHKADVLHGQTASIIKRTAHFAANLTNAPTEQAATICAAGQELKDSSNGKELDALPRIKKLPAMHVAMQGTFSTDIENATPHQPAD